MRAVVDDQLSRLTFDRLVPVRGWVYFRSGVHSLVCKRGWGLEKGLACIGNGPLYMCLLLWLLQSTGTSTSYYRYRELTATWHILPDIEGRVQRQETTQELVR